MLNLLLGDGVRQHKLLTVSSFCSVEIYGLFVSSVGPLDESSLSQISVQSFDILPQEQK